VPALFWGVGGLCVVLGVVAQQGVGGAQVPRVVRGTKEGDGMRATTRIAPWTAEDIENASTPEPNTGCWLWLGPEQAQGYGILHIEGRKRLAHRVSYALVHGPFFEWLNILHRCDNPPCVNPAHLFLGTQADNVADRDQKGRTARGEMLSAYQRGERARWAKLTAAQVAEIRAALAGGASQSAVAVRYGVTQSNINRIATGRIWRDT